MSDTGALYLDEAFRSLRGHKRLARKVRTRLRRSSPMRRPVPYRRRINVLMVYGSRCQFPDIDCLRPESSSCISSME